MEKKENILLSIDRDNLKGNTNIKGTELGTFLRGDEAGFPNLIEVASYWEVWSVIFVGPGQFAIRNNQWNNYLSGTSATTVTLNSIAYENLTNKEKWAYYFLDDAPNTYAFRNVHYYESYLRGDINKTVNMTTAGIGAWEKWTILYNSFSPTIDNKLGYKENRILPIEKNNLKGNTNIKGTSLGTFLRGDEAGFPNLIEVASYWEVWSVILVGPGKIAIRNNQWNNYLSATSSTTVTLNSIAYENLTNKEKWEWIPLSDEPANTYAFRNIHYYESYLRGDVNKTVNMTTVGIGAWEKWTIIYNYIPPNNNKSNL